jgi:hypothetical protein
MRTRPVILPSVLLALLLIVVGCEDKPPLLQAIPETQFDTAYVQITPSFTGFNQPEDIVIGNDQLLYVADTRNNRVVMLNRAGQVLSQRRILQPISIAQDSRLDLLVGGVIVATNGDSIGAVFRLDLVAVNHRLDSARVDTIWTEPAKPARRFPGIAIFGDNTYLLVRTGPDNSSFVDPDGRVLQFAANDDFITPIAGLTTRAGTGITDIFKPTSIAAFPNSRDFVLGQTADQVAYGALWLVYQSNPEFEGWLPRFDPARTEDRSRDFIRPNRFVRPEAVAIDRSRRDIFIADAKLDSIFKFNSRGAFKSESFGLFKTGGRVNSVTRDTTYGAMRRPTGLAYFERVLYVLDGDMGEVLRFRLTTDTPR